MTEGMKGFYDKIVQNDYWMSKLLDAEDLKVWKCDELWEYQRNLRVLYVKMKGSDKWVIDYKWERFCKLCVGYSRENEVEYVLNIPWYLKKVVGNYCDHIK